MFSIKIQNHPNSSSFFSVIFGSFCLALGAFLIIVFQPRKSYLETIDLNMVPPPMYVERFVFGYKETVADLLWLRLVQDFTVCESVAGGIAHVEGVKRAGHACRQGWVYRMVDAVTNLAPDWILPYRTGALLLSVAVDDIEGATKIFEKGLARFPYDYSLNYNASYHYIWEVKNPQRAAVLLLTAAKNGGPSWLFSLAGKMYSQAGQAELAKGVLEDALKDISEGDKSRGRLEDRLAEVNKILQTEATKESKK